MGLWAKTAVASRAKILRTKRKNTNKIYLTVMSSAQYFKVDSRLLKRAIRFSSHSVR